MENIEIMSILDADFQVLGSENIITKKSSYLWLVIVIGLLILVAAYIAYTEYSKKKEADSLPAS